MDQLHPSAAAGTERVHLLRIAADAGALLSDTYRAPAAGTLRQVALDAMTALYDRRSGATHLVAAPVPDILDQLSEPLSLGALATALDVADERSALAERLDELVAIGLVERVAP